MTLPGTDPESYITECTLAYTDESTQQVGRLAGPRPSEEETTTVQKGAAVPRRARI